MAIHLKKNDLINTRQMEVAVHGPDGATHLILCTGIAELGKVHHETYTFLVGPRLERRQFVSVIASGALSKIQTQGTDLMDGNPNGELGASLASIDADYDDETGQVKVEARVLFFSTVTKMSISYNVSILAELPMY